MGGLHFRRDRSSREWLRLPYCQLRNSGLADVSHGLSGLAAICPLFENSGGWFAPDGEALVAAQTGLKPITAYKLLRTLEREKFLRRLAGTMVRYVIGHAVHEIKSMDDGRTLLTEAGRALLRAQRKFPEAHFVLIQDEGAMPTRA